jgi:hypothetical protein
VAQQTVWDFMVQQVGVRQARRLASFIECWWVSQAVWEMQPTSQLMVDDWGFTEHEVSYWLREFGDVFRSESGPTRLAAVLAAEDGSVGMYSVRRTPLRRLADSA